MAKRPQIFGVFHKMAADGVFDANPANASAENYTGPQAFPCMVYHPTGSERVTRAAELIMTPFGPKAVGEERELVSKICANQAELTAALAEGWHEKPINSLRAGEGKEAVKSDGQIIAEQNEELAALRAQLKGATVAEKEQAGARVLGTKVAVAMGTGQTAMVGAKSAPQAPQPAPQSAAHVPDEE